MFYLHTCKGTLSRRTCYVRFTYFSFSFFILFRDDSCLSMHVYPLLSILTNQGFRISSSFSYPLYRTHFFFDRIYCSNKDTLVTNVTQVLYGIIYMLLLPSSTITRNLDFENDLHSLLTENDLRNIME